MKVIMTSFRGPTNTKPSKIVASDMDGNMVTISVDSVDCKTMDHEEAHIEAARQLCAKMGWTGRLVHGGTKTGYVFVFDHDGQIMMWESALEIKEYHAHYDKQCTGGCPAMALVRRLERVTSEMSHPLPTRANKTQRIHDAQRGN